MSNQSRRGGRRPGQQHKNPATTEAEQEVDIDTSNPVVVSFQKYAKELDDKHDRYERIVKLGRDITIESKRIIFLLHTIDSRKDNREKILKEAAKRLNAICEINFAQIAQDLGDLDQHQYSRAFSPGLQEFIEAYSFYEYLNESPKLSNWIDLQMKLKYVTNPPDSDSPSKETCCLIRPIEFMLGLADLGGEIMRRCINSLGSNEIEACFQSCRTLQALYSGYLRIRAFGNRDLPRKITILLQSTLKAENVCYNIKVRGNEAPKWNAIESFNADKPRFEEDEGFY